MRHAGARQILVAALGELAERGLNVGTSGNISVRVPGGFLISPSGVAPQALRTRDVVELDESGEPRKRSRAPSSEWRIHRDLLKARSEAGAVVHVHSPHATALACLRRPIPPFHYLVGLAGGTDIPVAEYATFGTQALSRNVLAALTDRWACLMANHGQIALGSNLGSAVALVREVEDLAQQYLLALQAGQEPVHLSSEQMVEANQGLAHYLGQPTGPSGAEG